MVPIHDSAVIFGIDWGDSEGGPRPGGLLVTGSRRTGEAYLEAQTDPCSEADGIAAAYAAKFAWADEEALKLYFRLEQINDTLRGIAAHVHENAMPGAKRWSVAILRALYLAPGNRLSHAEIAAQTRVPPANVTYQVDVMQRGGYVRRVAHETDRRITLVELTPLGRETCDRLLPARAEFINELGKTLSDDERAQFNELLGRLQLAISALNPTVSKSHLSVRAQPSGRAR